jgi:hypothetical protein
MAHEDRESRIRQVVVDHAQRHARVFSSNERLALSAKCRRHELCLVRHHRRHRLAHLDGLHGVTT